MALVAISHGHELTTPGKRTPPIPELNNRVIRENEFNKAVALILEEALKRCGIDVIDVSATDNDTLADRVKRANDAKADIFVAIHYNAFDGEFDDYDPEGFEVYILAKGGEAEKLANLVLAELAKGTPQVNRGLKVSSFYVLKYTYMPAILTECGYMDNKREAMLMLDPEFQKEVAIEHAKAICKYFNVKYVPGNSEQIATGTSIMGESECTAGQLEAFLLSKNQNPKINISLADFCQLWINEGEIEGVRGDIAFCQACHETGYFKYGGLVLPAQNNYGGIGATNDSKVGKGDWFDTPQMGVQASIQHLKAYGSKEATVQKIVDPRFNLVTRGIAPNFEDLGGRWAWPGYDKSKYSSLEAAKAAGDSYGHSILKKYDEMKKMTVVNDIEEENQTPEPDERIQQVKKLMREALEILSTIE